MGRQDDHGNDIVLVSRLVKVPVYLSNMKFIKTLPATTNELLSYCSFSLLTLALLAGAGGNFSGAI
jgi:hypothetical protein